MFNLSSFVVYTVGIYCFAKLYWNLTDSNYERERLKKRLTDVEKEAKEKEEEEEEVRRMVRIRREREAE